MAQGERRSGKRYLLSFPATRKAKICKYARNKAVFSSPVKFYFFCEFKPLSWISCGELQPKGQKPDKLDSLNICLKDCTRHTYGSKPGHCTLYRGIMTVFCYFQIQL